MVFRLSKHQSISGESSARIRREMPGWVYFIVTPEDAGCPSEEDSLLKFCLNLRKCV